MCQHCRVCSRSYLLSKHQPWCKGLQERKKNADCVLITNMDQKRMSVWVLQRPMDAERLFWKMKKESIFQGLQGFHLENEERLFKVYKVSTWRMKRGRTFQRARVHVVGRQRLHTTSRSDNFGGYVWCRVRLEWYLLQILRLASLVFQQCCDVCVCMCVVHWYVFTVVLRQVLKLLYTCPFNEWRSWSTEVDMSQRRTSSCLKGSAGFFPSFWLVSFFISTTILVYRYYRLSHQSKFAELVVLHLWQGLF